MFTGRHIAVARDKQAAMDARYAANPERFVAGPPALRLPPPEKVVINPFAPEELVDDVVPTVNFATLNRVKCERPPAKAGGFVLRLKPDWSALRRTVALSR